ncbi:MAG: hypothetical protein JJ859_12985 [Roseicyclus sp.]|nr:hypothetical protein [Roseicyclus sp.]
MEFFGTKPWSASNFYAAKSWAFTAFDHIFQVDRYMELAAFGGRLVDNQRLAPADSVD